MFCITMLLIDITADDIMSAEYSLIVVNKVHTLCALSLAQTAHAV